MVDRILGLLLLVLLLSPGSSHASQWAAQMRVDRDTVELGDRFTLWVEVTAPRNAQVDLPGWISALQPCDVLDWNVEQAVKGMAQDWHKKIWKAQLRTFEAGALTLGPLGVEGVFGGDTLRMDVSPLNVLVKERLADTVVEILDVAPPMADPHWPWWVWTLIGVSLLACFIILWMKYRKIRAAVQADPVLPPYEEALSALELLQKRSLLENDDQAEFFTELGMIVRRYIQRRYTVDVLDATTVELRQRLAHVRGLPQAYRESMVRFATEAEPIKFARLHIEVKKAQEWEAWAQRLLNDTRPAPESTEGGKV